MSASVRLSDFVIDFLANKGIEHVFTVVGGGSIWLCDSLKKTTRVKYVSCHNELYASIAAEAYARVRNSIGAAVVTSGPGGTNTLTGVSGAWLDHVPHITISGQAFLQQTVFIKPGLRTLGVQEINIIDIVKPVTKYAVMVKDAKKIRYHLEKAFFLAFSGKPGPVWIDLPGNVQNAQINPDELIGFEEFEELNTDISEDFIEAVAIGLFKAKRPLIHIGQGVRLSGAIESFFRLIEKLRIPFVTARNGNDIVASDYEYFVGRPGTYAQRAANFAVQVCDFYVAIGTKLTYTQTGYNSQDYARNAVKVVVDIDKNELDKDTMHVDFKIQSDAGKFISSLLKIIEKQASVRPEFWDNWLAKCKEWQGRYNVVLPEYSKQVSPVNSYYFLDVLSDVLDHKATIVTDMGFSFQNTHQVFKVKPGQRLFTNCNLASMGWGLPASVGASFGTDEGKVVLIAGEGGLMMTIGDLATIMHHNLPVKLFIFNNGGYLTIKQTQEAGFDSEYMGINNDSGISFPNFKDIAAAHHISYLRVEDQINLAKKVKNVVTSDGPFICELIMDHDQAQAPKIMKRKLPDGTMSQAPIEDLHPFLDPQEVKENLSFGKDEMPIDKKE